MRVLRVKHTRFPSFGAANSEGTRILPGKVVLCREMRATGFLIKTPKTEGSNPESQISSILYESF